MGVFFLKENDTRPIFETILKNPDGTVHVLAGTLYLHIFLADGTTKLERTLAKFDIPNGIVRYTWVAADWNAGNLVPTPSLTPEKPIHTMEYEEVSGTSRLTFPNDGRDELRISPHIADGT